MCNVTVTIIYLWKLIVLYALAYVTMAQNYRHSRPSLDRPGPVWFGILELHGLLSSLGLSHISRTVKPFLVVASTRSDDQEWVNPALGTRIE